MHKGNASYYSNKLHGRRMSNGDPYHRDSMTCAHLKYPLGTYLCVRNPKNGKEVVVKVTDRGPHTKRFAIDLSLAAARELDIIHKGFTMVEITPCPEDKVPYRSGKTEYDFLQPQFDPTLPVRTWNHPEWNEQEDAEVEASEEEISEEANAEKPTEETSGKDSKKDAKEASQTAKAATEPAKKDSKKTSKDSKQPAKANEKPAAKASEATAKENKQPSKAAASATPKADKKSVRQTK